MVWAFCGGSAESIPTLEYGQQLSCPGNRNVPNTEARNAFPERSEQPVLIRPSICMTVTAAGGEKILAILPLKCAIFSANQGFCGYAT